MAAPAILALASHQKNRNQLADAGALEVLDALSPLFLLLYFELKVRRERASSEVMFLLSLSFFLYIFTHTHTHTRTHAHTHR